MGLADLGEAQLEEFGVQALTHAKPLPASPGQEPLSRCFKSSHPQKMSFKAKAKTTREAEDKFSLPSQKFPAQPRDQLTACLTTLNTRQGKRLPTVWSLLPVKITHPAASLSGCLVANDPQVAF